MTVYFTDVFYEFEFSAGVWTDVSSLVMGSAKGSFGIKGWGPMDRVANVGKFKFSIRNIANAYTPGAVGCTAGFEEGVAFRLRLSHHGTSKYRFYGHVASGGIAVESTPWLSVTKVVVEDFMGQMRDHELVLPAYTTNKYMEQVMALIEANMSLAPLSSSYAAGKSLFANVFDTTKEKTSALSEASKLALSELGYVFVKNGSTAGTAEVLTSEGRYTRKDKAIRQIDVWNGAAFVATNVDIDNFMREAGITHAQNYYNDVKAMAYPRRHDSTPVALYNLEQPIFVDGGETVTITGRYADPQQQSSRVSGINMIAPVATTDYLFNSKEDGTGFNITGSLSVTTTFGTNGVSFSISSLAQPGYLIFLQARGYGVYVYNTVEHRAQDAALIAANGRRTLSLDMKYESNPMVARDFATVMLTLWKEKRTVVEEIEMVANRSEFLASLFTDIQVGDKILLQVDSALIRENYFVQGMDFELKPGGLVSYALNLQPENISTPPDYWKIGVTGLGEIGVSTIVGY
jgi:hypothetical protein